METEIRKCVEWNVQWFLLCMSSTMVFIKCLHTDRHHDDISYLSCYNNFYLPAYAGVVRSIVNWVEYIDDDFCDSFFMKNWSPVFSGAEPL